MKKTAYGVALLASLFISTSFAAPISSEVDSSLTGATLVDFESGPTGNSVSQSFGGLAVTALNSVYASSASFSVDGDYAGGYNTRGQLHITNHGSEFQALRFDFSASTAAFGFLFGASDSSWVLQAFNGSGLLESLTISPVFGSNAGDFFGLSNLAGATYALLTQNQDGYYASGGVDYVFVDNFRFAQGSVPEPASLALLGIGLAGVGAMRRKSRS